MSIDDTRNRIGVGKMEDAEKKQLFQKFQDHGGEVIDENKRTRQQMFDKQKQQEYLKKNSSKRPPAHPEYHSAISPSVIKKDKKGFSAKIKGIFNRMRLYFKSVSQGVRNSSGGGISSKFFETLSGPVQSTLLDLELLLTPLVHAPNELKNKLQLKLNSSRSFYYELLLRLKEVYNERELKELLYKFRQNRYAHISPESIGEPLRLFYKRLYILRNYSQSCTNALIQALEIQAEIEKKERVALKRNIQRARKNIHFVFNTLLPKLHFAVLNILKEYLPLGHRKLDKFVELKENDRIGFLTEKISTDKQEVIDKKEEFLKKKKEEENKQKAAEIKASSLSETIRNGLAIMKDIPVTKEALVTAKDSAFAYLELDNKMYLTEAFFNEIEREYIFLLASNQIKIAMAYQAGKRTDYKQELCDLAIEFEQVHEMIQEFNENVIENSTIEKSPTYSLTQKSKLLHKLSLTCAKANNQIRVKLAAIAGKTETILKSLLADYKSEQHFLQNPEDTIDFEVNMDRKKKLQGKTVLDSIIHIFNFMAALRYRLSDGDLSGYSSKIENRLVYDSFEEAPPVEESDKAPEDKTEEQTNN